MSSYLHTLSGAQKGAHDDSQSNLHIFYLLGLLLRIHEFDLCALTFEVFYCRVSDEFATTFA